MQERDDQVSKEAARIARILADGQTITPSSLARSGSLGDVTCEALGMLLSQGLAYRSEYSQPASHTNFRGTARLSRLDKAGLLVAALEDQPDFRGLWHPEVERVSREDFSQGNYDDAIMAATKRLEVRVRDCSARLPNETIGEALMDAAFGPDGPLHKAEPGSKKSHGTMMLAKGAMAVFRNPTHHYDVGHNDAIEVAQILCFISYLITQAERRSPYR